MDELKTLLNLCPVPMLVVNEKNDVIFLNESFTRKNIFCFFLLLLLFVITPCIAETGEPTKEEIKVILKKDKSGTNPANLRRTFLLTNEYTNSPGKGYVNIINFKYTQPFKGRFLYSVKIPIVSSDSGEDTTSGLGDIDMNFGWRAYMTRGKGPLLKAFVLMVGNEFTFDTATDRSLGSGKYLLAPNLTSVFIFPKGVIFAPSFKHSFSFAGQDDREDINRSALDLYFVLRNIAKKYWVLLDPAIIVDHEHDTRVSMTTKITYGRMLSENLSCFVRPGLPIGGNKTMDWGIDAGLKYIW
jgi:hypothetical protein